MVYANFRLYKRAFFVLTLFLILSLCFLSGCSEDNSTGPDTPQITKITISPGEAALEAGDQIDFSVYALTEVGDTVNTDEIDIDWQWWSTDPDVFTVEQGGLATGQNTGEAFCVVEATVSVSQSIAEDLDIQYAGIGLNGNEKENTELKNMKLLLKNTERLENVNAVVKKNRLRFVGRDSAIVFVF